MNFLTPFRFFIPFGLALSLFAGCRSHDNSPLTNGEDESDTRLEKIKDIKKLRFFDEYIIPKDFRYDGVEVGGLSDLSYDGDYVYAVSDEGKEPHIYKFSLDFEEQKIDTLRLEEIVPIQRTVADSLAFDFEGLIFDSHRNRFILSSEGNIKAGKDGFVAELDRAGQFVDFYDFPDYFRASNEGGPQNNSVFEGLCASIDNRGLWVSTELPLKMDLPSDSSDSAIRFTRFDKDDKKPTRQFFYPLNRSKGDNPVMKEGVSAILEYQPNQFLVLERSLMVSLEYVGFQAQLFVVDARDATNTLDYKNGQSEIDKEIIPAKKELLLDFQDIREELTNHTIDNLEGLAFGPVLPNGNQSLILISDNNFNAVIPQLNQVIALEIVE